MNTFFDFFDFFNLLNLNLENLENIILIFALTIGGFSGVYGLTILLAARKGAGKFFGGALAGLGIATGKKAGDAVIEAFTGNGGTSNNGGNAGSSGDGGSTGGSNTGGGTISTGNTTGGTSGDVSSGTEGVTDMKSGWKE